MSAALATAASPEARRAVLRELVEALRDDVELLRLLVEVLRVELNRGVKLKMTRAEYAAHRAAVGRPVHIDTIKRWKAAGMPGVFQRTPRSPLLIDPAIADRWVEGGRPPA